MSMEQTHYLLSLQGHEIIRKHEIKEQPPPRPCIRRNDCEQDDLDDSLEYSRLNNIVDLITKKLSKASICSLNNRAVQAKIYQIPEVSSYMADLYKRKKALR